MATATVLAGPERRRRWTPTEKLRLVEDSLTAGVSVAEFARQRDIHPNLIHAWRHQARRGALSGRSDTKARFTPVAIVAGATPATVREARDTAMIEVVLRNGRVLRLCAGVEPGNAARLADALEGCR
ncbi:MAG TPA: transposase [Stellaceae bacterium]|jgi:transposase